MKKHKPMSEEEYQSLLPSEKEIEKTMNELKESLSSHDPEAAAFDPNTQGCDGTFMYTGCDTSIALVTCDPNWPSATDCLVV